MKLLKPLFDFYIYSSIHVALSVVCLAWITMISFHISIDQPLLLFVFFASITGYNFVKYFGLAKFHHRSLVSWLKIVQLFSFICFGLMVYFVLQLQKETLWCIAGLGLITFLYAIPFLPQHFFMDEQKNLRSVGGLKVYVIAMVWAGVTVLLPVVNNAVDVTMDVWLVAMQRFIFVMLLMLPFEIRDLQYDSLKLSTIPQKIGVRNTKLIGVLSALLFVGIEYFKIASNAEDLFIHALIGMLSIGLIIKAKKYQNKYYSAFWVEGIPIFWLCLQMVF